MGSMVENLLDQSQLERIVSTTHALQRVLAQTDDLNEFCRALCDLVPVDACTIRVLDGGALNIRARWGVAEAYVIPAIRVDEGIGRTLVEERAVVIMDAADDETVRSPFQSTVGIPITTGDQILGVLGLYRLERAGDYHSLEIEHLKIVASCLAAKLLHTAVIADLWRANSNLDASKNDATVRLHDMTAQFEQFTYSVAHELRSPLRAIYGFGYVLEKDYGHAIPKPALELVHRQMSGSTRLAGLIDDLLGLANVSRSSVQRSRVDLGDLGTRIWHGLNRPNGHCARLTCEPDLSVQADAKLVRQLLVHLIDNATKFAAPDRDLEVQIGSRQIEGRRVFFVRDNGIGFDHRYADRIFKPFERLVTLDEFPGNGIGLAVVKRVIEMHSGSHWAISTPGEGTTIYFTLGEED